MKLKIISAIEFIILFIITLPLFLVCEIIDFCEVANIPAHSGTDGKHRTGDL